jgi:hypothetical protein
MAMALIDSLKFQEIRDQAVADGYKWGVNTCAERLEKLAHEYREHGMFEAYILLFMVSKLFHAENGFNDAKLKAWAEASMKAEVERKQQYRPFWENR